MKVSKKSPKAPPLKKLRSIHGVNEYRLPNGLRFLFKRDRSAPVVAVCVTFHVGSRNEAAGHTGATHILEHLLFKDTENFNKKNGKAITDYLEWMGAIMNATTWLDRTNYFELLPREHLAEALRMEADRMRNSRFSAEDLASEMTVVRNEYERGRNDPYEILSEKVLETAFREHPYRIPTIGLKEDIEHSNVEKLREFYDTFYWPNNATLAVYGDVTSREAEELVVKYFGAIPASPHEIPAFNVVEPVQKKARSCEVQKAAGVSIAQIAYHTPRAGDPAYAAALGFVMVMAGGFSSRLQKAIVDKGLAADISPFVYPTFDPGIATFTATAAPNVAAGVLIARMRAQIEKAAKEGITKAELDRARNRLLSEISQEHDGVFHEIRAVSESVAAGDWTLTYRLEADLKKLTPALVNGVARRYFTRANETAGILNDTTQTP